MSPKTNWFIKSRRAQSNEDYETWNEGGVTPTMNAFDNGDVRTTVLIIDGTRVGDVRVYEDEIAPTVISRYGTGGGIVPAILTSTVRRLTPVECEKLQGFPVEWTKYDVDGKEQADSHRYKQMGNAVAVPVVEWIIANLVKGEE